MSSDIHRSPVALAIPPQTADHYAGGYRQRLLIDGKTEVRDRSITSRKLAGSVIEQAYPVGSVYINASVSTNPATLLGFGTWERYGQGRVLVSQNDSDTEFNTLGETGGAKTHTLTANQSGTRAHSHGISQTQHTHGIYTDANNANSNMIASEVKLGPAIANNKTVASAGANANITINNATATNASEAHNNLQPYITVYMWRRTA